MLLDTDNHSLGNRVFCSSFTTEREGGPLKILLVRLVIFSVVKRVEIGPGEFVVIPVTYKKNLEEAWTLLSFSTVPIQLTPVDQYY